jgi:hypothetical protein
MKSPTRILWPALLAASVASAQVTLSPRAITLPAPAPAEPRTELAAPRPGVAEALAIDPQIAELRHALAQLRREVADQQRDLQALHACVADLALAARGGPATALAATQSVGKAMDAPAQFAPVQSLASAPGAAPLSGNAALAQAPPRFRDCG